MALAKKLDLKASMSVGDIIYQILKNQGNPLHYRELVDQVLAIKPLQSLDSGRKAARVLTEMNLDNRFLHLGGGNWTLREKLSPKAIKQYDDDWEN